MQVSSFISCVVIGPKVGKLWTFVWYIVTGCNFILLYIMCDVIVLMAGVLKVYFYIILNLFLITNKPLRTIY